MSVFRGLVQIQKSIERAQLSEVPAHYNCIQFFPEKLPMLVDSHCHLDFPELAGQIDSVFALMRTNDVAYALSVSVTLEDFPNIRAIAEANSHIFASVGVHPDYADAPLVTVEMLKNLADHPKVVAIGETGLDYFRLKGDLEWQRERFRTHIRDRKSTRLNSSHDYRTSLSRMPSSA
jgi:Tat protein secretion system quality control protein TatD with DNase activity